MPPTTVLSLSHLLVTSSSLFSRPLLMESVCHGHRPSCTPPQCQPATRQAAAVVQSLPAPQQPCSSCSLRGQICTYAEHPPTVPVPSLHDRLVQLERLVMYTANQPNTAGASADGPLSIAPDTKQLNPADSTVPADTSMDERSECGSMRVSASEFRYVGGDHWAAILDSIADLKDHFDQEEHLRLANTPDPILDYDDHNDGHLAVAPHAMLLYGCHRPVASRADILAALPPKSAVDRYISRYFNGLDLVAACRRGPCSELPSQGQQRCLFAHGGVREANGRGQYEAFWANPSSVPIMWIGLLFSMICLAVVAADSSDFAHGSEPAEQQSLQIDLYREKIVQCLIKGEYTKAGPYVLETFIHYVYVEFGIRADADNDIWFLLATEVNLAMRMGYHRDPSHFPGISPLEGEMRRRLWATIVLGDILISSQMGMPRMISDWQCDTAEPRNLNDSDLNEEMVQLPPSRPETENTTALAVIARRRILIALGAISDLTTAVKSPNYTEVRRVDSKLQEAEASIPPPLKMKSMAASVTDSPQIIMSRLFISHMFYKGKMMLHRRFLFAESASQDGDTFAYSREACLDAALGTLQIQNILDEETCSGGQLHTMRWRVTSSMNHQFLTATMILCSLLHRGQMLHRREAITAALQRTRTIWMRRSSNSREAKKAAETVSIVLARAGDGRGYDVERDRKDVNNSLDRQSIATDSSSTINSSDYEIGFDGQEMMVQEFTGLYDFERFAMPAVLGSFTSPDPQEQYFTNMNPMKNDMVLDERMVMNEPGMAWW
ncbi:fungal specific transcription factor-1 [Coleophoma crateriformis]|uniref:Fungal specific transcription factor-1 n=1 Tax=Coleophoma crateriformis TaxID=565419 RepID=A0A3D8QBK8_9HELO|nr:fungal specific transcription factor-1 [Coleophoma crateriformis]